MKNRFFSNLPVIGMLIIVLVGYYFIHNLVYIGESRYTQENWHNSSTIKFVNCWLEEGACNLKYLMFENPKSIEYDDIYERNAYISYPSGVVFPPFIAAKLTGKDEIHAVFVLKFLEYKYLVDVLLFCFLFYSFFSITLNIKKKIPISIASALLSLIWMFLPDNMFWLRNVFFSDQFIITLVLAFTILEIWSPLIENKKAAIRWIFYSFKFLLSIYGVLTDYYFLFVLFVSWLVKIVPLFKLKEHKYSVILKNSAIYVLPVIFGLGLYVWQISNDPNCWSKIMWKIEERTMGEIPSGRNLFLQIIMNFVKSYTAIGALSVSVFLAFLIKNLIYHIKHKVKIEPEYIPFYKIGIIICVPPILQIFTFMNHSSIHMFAMIKFGLPFMFSVFAFTYYNVTKYKPSLGKNGIFVGTILLSSVLIAIANLIIIYGPFKYYKSYKNEPVEYTLAHTIRDHYHYEDVYFSFTDSIPDNQPIELAISKKRMYRIDDLSDIYSLFPKLKSNANKLIVINNDVQNKSDCIRGKEDFIERNGILLYSKENYAVYNVNNLANTK